MDRPTFSLSAAVLGDARQLAEVAARAFESDANTQVKAAVRPPGAFADGMAAGIRTWLEAPARCAVIKATDDVDGRIAGFICWGFRGVEVEPPPGADAGGSPGTATEPPGRDGRHGPTPPPPKDDAPPRPPSPAATARVDALEKMTGAHLAAFQEEMMPVGARCLYVVAVAVDPGAQGRGAGARLIRWGTARADGAGVFCWVHASEAGAAAFARHGFREVDRLAVDLDRWAAGPPPPGRGDDYDDDEGRERRWGEYVFRSMVRQPGPREEADL